MAARITGIRTAMDRFSLEDNDPRDSSKFCQEVYDMKENSASFFNVAAQIDDSDAIPSFDDIDADGYTDENVKQAVAALRTKMLQLFGNGLGDKIMKRIPQRVYQSGIHTASNGTTRIAKWVDTERKDWLDTISDDDFAAAGIDPANVEAFKEESENYIPYSYFQKAMNLLKGLVSKKMLVRIIVKKLHSIHNQNNVDESKPNVFLKSIEKFGLDEEVEKVPKEFRYFGADLHPGFKGKGKIAYSKLRKQIFDLSKEAADQPSGETMF